MLSETARRRLADIVELQPTKNAELQEQWGLDSGSDVHQYLEAELEEYYYRDEDSLIRATPAADDLVEDIVDSTPASSIQVTDRQATLLTVLPGPDERAQSVVSLLHALETETDDPPSADTLQSELTKLADRGLVTVVDRLVPTYKRAAEDIDATVGTE